MPTPKQGLRGLVLSALLTFAFLASLISVSASPSTTSSVPVAAITAAAGTSNLFANPGAETPVPNDSTKAEGWESDGWGGTAKFDYVSPGLAGDHSLRTTFTPTGGGDAKQFPTAVAVTPGQTLSYSNLYKSTTTTHVVFEAFKADGKSTYDDVAINVKAAPKDPATVRGTIKVPAGTVKLTVMQLLEKPGVLTVDSVKLAPLTTKITDRVPNNSVEVADPAHPSRPLAWTPSAWGTNKHKFSYVANDGHAGHRSVRTCITKYGSDPGVAGDAKWMFTTKLLTPGSDYRTSFWYKSNALLKENVVVRFVRADGSEEFFGMPQPEPKGGKATKWTKYSDTFSVPADAVGTSVFMITRGVGCTSMDDFHITPYHYTGFDTGRVVLTFDDDPDINVVNALPVLNQYGFKTTQYIPTGDLQKKGAAAKKLQAAVRKFAKGGHEIGSHTITHPHLPSLACSGTKLNKGTRLTHELVDSRTYLRKLTGQPVRNFASPYGEYIPCVNAHIKAAGYGSHRTVDEGFNSKDNFNQFRLRVQNMTPTTPLATVEGWYDKAAQDNTTLVLVYHNIDDRDNAQQHTDTFDTYLQDFLPQMAALDTRVRSGSLKVVTMQQALLAMRAQT